MGDAQMRRPSEREWSAETWGPSAMRIYDVDENARRETQVWDERT